ncbi:MAG TPA: hypothetical protein VJN71_08740 [Nitrososphaerales archaeon]|nr:hypothetical protein [Nitrososphaerales archaeon]
MVSGTFIYATVHLTNNSSANINSSTLSGDCLVSIPDNASVFPKVNSTFAGFYELYQNRTVAYYPYGSCPQPVQDSLYRVALKVEEYSTFVKLENGSTYLYDPEYSGCCGISTKNGTVVGKNAVLQFDDWSNIHIRSFNDSVPPACWPYVPSIIVMIPVDLTKGNYVLANMTLSHSSDISAGPKCTL